VPYLGICSKRDKSWSLNTAPLLTIWLGFVERLSFATLPQLYSTVLFIIPSDIDNWK